VGGGGDRGYTTERVPLPIRFVCQANPHVNDDVEIAGRENPCGWGDVAGKGGGRSSVDTFSSSSHVFPPLETKKKPV
jgi:hypothetical protein